MYNDVVEAPLQWITWVFFIKIAIPFVFVVNIPVLKWILVRSIYPYRPVCQ